MLPVFSLTGSGILLKIIALLRSVPKPLIQFFPPSAPFREPTRPGKSLWMPTTAFHLEGDLEQ